MNRIRPDKPPKRTTGFSWGRTRTPRCELYRLFRRDLNGAIHFSSLSVDDGCERRLVAKSLRRMYRDLRDKVDGIDLQFMEMTSKGAQT